MLTQTSPAAAAPGFRRFRMMADGSVDIELLYTQYLDAVLGYVLQRVPDRAEAEDITAETFMAAIIALPRFRGECGPYAWLVGIARQKVAEALRRRGRRRELLSTDLTEWERENFEQSPGPETRALPEQAALHAEARGMMGQLLDRLTTPQREAILLQLVDDLSIKEIARVMGRSVAATNSLLERARATLFRLGKNYFGVDCPDSPG